MNSPISEIELQRINQQLPNLKELFGEVETFLESGPYQMIFICVFDHWLSREEVDDQIFIDEDPEELKSCRQKFQDFIEQVNGLTQLYSWKNDGLEGLLIQKPESWQDVLDECDFENLWSKVGRRYGFLLPEYSAV